MTIPVFAQNGDKTTVPTGAQTDGSVSWDAGFPIAYEGNLASDPSARNIERGKFNKIMFDITTAIKTLFDADYLPKVNGVATNLTLAADAATAMQATTLRQVQAAIAAIPADKYLQGLSGYNATTNVMSLLMHDGSTVNVDMTALVNDAVASIPASVITSPTVLYSDTGDVGATYLVNSYLTIANGQITMHRAYSVTAAERPESGIGN